MEIIRSAVLGFCFGVRRAVELAEKALADNSSKVYSLGPLIHNENALSELKNKGLCSIEENNLASIPNNAVVIIRAHGVSPTVIQRLEKKNCKIIDATCPRVKASQKMVEKYTNGNDCVIITGDKNHGEMIGIAGYAGKNFYQVQNLEEAEKITLKTDASNVILMSQTTFSIKEFESIERYIKKTYKNTAVMNTICPATNERQSALLDLCKIVDGVVVIGGKVSANTKRLYQTARENCKNAVHVQTYDDIPDSFLKLKKIGITAGASTPDYIISEVEDYLLNNQI